ncbi:uncharacterized protein (DUF58 family) [Nocardioides sp. BE266]|uniref:DUF58 domain-containing protein n=1 Tax=Nocardioides sp. BE266 TaxID=2817725 RepID=UPI0028541BB8|nr:DUF58 domain-containing protein [Nocardioides sp. BE266]MDR7251758.1 uncharacterized protein (DUF58 family) [Nocardioides sp. BE266]
MRQRLNDALEVIKPIGWLVLGLGLGAAMVATFTAWRELAVLGTACLLLLVLAVPFLLGRTSVSVDLRLQPERVAAGESVAAGVLVVNRATTRLVPTTLEVPVGSAIHRYGVSSLAPGAAHEESFTIRTERRGVISVGPAMTRRGDPVGLFSRDMVWTPVREVLVRPHLVPMESLGAGLLRDLEGVSTDAVSQSDLAFHALREYVPGDDLRHIHWRSSAKVMASSGESALLVRQYLDTRRSHATIVVDDRLSAWADPDDFETAMAVAASIAVRAVLDEFDVSFVCGQHASTGSDGYLALDAVCRAEFGDRGLIESGRQASTLAPDTSLAFFIGGNRSQFTDMLRSAAAFPPEVRRFGIVVDPEGTSRVTETGGLPVLHLAAKEDLGGLLRWSVR